MWNEQNNQNSGNYQYGSGQGNQPYNGVPNNTQYGSMNNTQYSNQSYNNVQNSGQYGNQNYNTGMTNNTYGTNSQYNGMYNSSSNQPYNNLSNTSQYGNMMNSQYGQSYMNNQSGMPNGNGFSGYQVSTPNSKKPKNKKKLILAIIVVLVVIAAVIFFFPKSKNNQKKAETGGSQSSVPSGSNYDTVMIEYGSKAEEYIANYKEENGKFPDMIEVTDNVKVDYKVYCDEKIIYPDGQIYLNKCSINASDAIYTYGNPREENKLIKEYGALALTYVSDYVKVYGEIPTTLNVEYEVDIECDTVNIYDVNNIYLDKCSVNGSDKVYSYGYQKDKGFVYIAYTQLNNEVYGENTTAYYESESANSKVIKCATLNCTLDKYLGKYIAIKESTGKVGIYDITTDGDAIFTVDANITYTFLRDGDTSVYGLLLKNAKGQEALYTFYGKQYVYDYGNYYYDWSSNEESELVWDHYPLFAATNLIVVRKATGNKYGLVNLKTRKETIPCEYDLIFMRNKQLHVVKGNKIALYNSTGSSKRLKGKSYDALAVSNYNNNYTMVYGDNILEIVDIDGKLIKKVADVPATYTLLVNNPYDSIKLADTTTFQVVFKTNTTKTACARYTYDMTNMKLSIDLKECSYFSS